MSKADLNLGDIWERRYWECGQLLLDVQKSRAMLDDVDLELDEETFSALYLLVQRVDEGMTFEELYKAVWKPLDGADCWDEVRAAIAGLAKRLATADNNEMQIQILPDERFVLRRKETFTKSMNNLL